MSTSIPIIPHRTHQNHHLPVKSHCFSSSINHKIWTEKTKFMLTHLIRDQRYKNSLFFVHRYWACYRISWAWIRDYTETTSCLTSKLPEWSHTHNRELMDVSWFELADSNLGQCSEGIRNRVHTHKGGKWKEAGTTLWLETQCLRNLGGRKDGTEWDICGMCT